MTVPVQPTRRRRPELLAALFLICGLGAWACSRAPGAGDSPEADGGVAVRPEPEPARPAPTRLRRWPQLERWLRGESIAYEFHAEPLLPSETLAARGQQLFALYCYQCHGREGRGDGPRAPMFDPPPRDLTRAKYKFRSTPPGEPPAREDLYRTITLGLRGTGMVPFADLPSSERWALVEYVRELSGFDENDVPAVEAPTVPADVDDPARIARGAKAYSRNGCAACHGSGGRGDGPAAGSLRDSLGNPLRPADFGLRPLKRGAAADQIYLTLRTGLDGALDGPPCRRFRARPPMSFGTSLRSCASSRRPVPVA